MPRSGKWGVFRQVISAAGAAIVGAFLCSLVPADANIASLALVCIGAFCGWLFWVRRGSSLAGTVGICFLIIAVWWSLVIALR